MDEARAALAGVADGACRIVHKPERGPEGYHIEILASGIRLHAGDAHGVLYGAQTLRQIAEQYPAELPHLEITDSPDLPVRGFMLDVSRTRVPTQSELLALIRALGRLRVNQLQLYVEHTFAFRGHEDAWKDASPLTPPAELPQPAGEHRRRRAVGARAGLQQAGRRRTRQAPRLSRPPQEAVRARARTRPHRAILG
ncbi:MAG: hypothetical protein EBV31_04610 [Verrucomicrobia bacterium]|nr:hypothetical protein [Verrucomicrobiota bacterium]